MKTKSTIRFTIIFTLALGHQAVLFAQTVTGVNGLNSGQGEGGGDGIAYFNSALNATVNIASPLIGIGGNGGDSSTYQSTGQGGNGYGFENSDLSGAGLNLSNSSLIQGVGGNGGHGSSFDPLGLEPPIDGMPGQGIGVFAFRDGTFSTLSNSSVGSIVGQGGNSNVNGGTGIGVEVDQTSVGILSNAGSISGLGGSSGSESGGSGIGILNLGDISILNNFGSIYGLGHPGNSSLGSDGGGVGIYNLTTIGTLTNTGAIFGLGGQGSYGIINLATINTINNLQGAGNNLQIVGGALTYSGVLPNHYNIIINSPTQYGQLAVTYGTGATTFGIYAGGVSGVAASILNKGTYASVLSGVAASNITGATNGAYGGLSWSLSEVNVVNGIWDLLVYLDGPSTANTQQSLVNTAQALQGTYTLQNSVLANSFAYDCTVFGENDICVSAGGRNTAVQAANGLNNTSALLIAAYRALPSVRVGAYADQNLSVNNAGSTVNLGNNTPLIGLFAAWNERQDGTGSELKVSAAYGQKNTTVTRQVVGTGATASEAGSGSSTLNSQGAQVTAKYGFGVADQVIVSPYVGIRYTQNNMGGYTEATSTSVTTPLTYSALNTNATTALAGVGVSYSGIPQTNLFASAGVETDTNTANGSYNATGLTGLAPVNFNPNPVKTRPTAMLGASYDVEKNQRLGVTGIYRQEAYQATASTTVMATYTVGF